MDGFPQNPHTQHRRPVEAEAEQRNRQRLVRDSDKRISHGLGES